jgi:hypothetical protein
MIYGMVWEKRLKVLFFWLLLFTTSLFVQSDQFQDRDCLQCHEKSDLSQITSDGITRSLFVDPEKWQQDIHKKKGMTCVVCHLYSNPFVHFREGGITVNCARCHPEEEEEYQKNIHLSFKPESITPGKELPLCYHCHTTHQVLKHDDPNSSVHENHIGETCGQCHAEVMISGILKGSSLGKISGHRKGDLGEKFDMNVCINCHYADSAHGNKRVYKVFCSRCHDPQSKGNVFMGGTHINSARWSTLNMVAVGIVFLFLVIAFLAQGYRSSGKIIKNMKRIFSEIKAEKADKKEDEKESENHKQDPS